MLHIDDEIVRSLACSGGFGLEREGLRITEEGFMSHTPHPFPEDRFITRDFCENQVEINTSVNVSVHEALLELEAHDRRIQKTLSGMDAREYLWPFSNPPYIREEDDIPIARFGGEDHPKTIYRRYLADRYGRYIMTFCGIHVNFSFNDALIRREYELSQNQAGRQGTAGYQDMDFCRFKDMIYLDLAQKAMAYSWLIVALTAASPLLDASFCWKTPSQDLDKSFRRERGTSGSVFEGLASVRCSEKGYWNSFTPVLSYQDRHAYVESIRSYIREGLITSPSELYYPIRLKPEGENTLEGLESRGINHIELRMFDLNPTNSLGLEKKDLEFVQLLLLWLTARESIDFSGPFQILAADNFKQAAHYDLEEAMLQLPGGRTCSVREAGLHVLQEMEDFYRENGADQLEILHFQKRKLEDPTQRYASKVRELYSDAYVEKGISLARSIQEEKIR